MIVLSSGQRASEPDRQHQLRDRTDAAAGLDVLSSNSLYIVAPESGHEIHLYQPDLVAQALVRAVVAVRNQVPLFRATANQDK